MTRVRDRLDELDAAFGRLRRMWESPALRRRFRRRLGTTIDPGMVRTLYAIRMAGEAPAVGDVASWLDVDASTASRAVDAAVAAGYVERQRCASDRRRALVALTAEGDDVLDRAKALRRELLGELTSDWPDADVERFVELLERLAASVTEMEGD